MLLSHSDFYYNTLPGKDYQQTLLDVQAYWEALALPFRYIWLDSWWSARQHFIRPASPLSTPSSLAQSSPFLLPSKCSSISCPLWCARARYYKYPDSQRSTPHTE